MSDAVLRHVRAFLDSQSPGEPIRIVSAFAGAGDRLLPVIASHPRRLDVRARLVELDPQNVAAACEAVSELRLDWNVEIVCGDPSVADSYVGAVPADLVLLGHDAFDLLPRLCAPGATVIWADHRAG